jgi:adenylate cyclase
MMKKLLKKILKPSYLKVTLFIIWVYLVFMAVSPRIINNLEMKLYDFMFQLRGPQPVGSEIVIVAIDDDSVKNIGRWPWSRHEITRLVKVLRQAGAKVIGFDIIFAEKQESCEIDLLSRLQGEMNRRAWKIPELQQWVRQERQVMDPDTELTEEFKLYGNAVLGYYFQGLEKVDIGPGLFNLDLSKDIIKSSKYGLVRWTSSVCSPCPLLTARGIEINLPKLTAAAGDTGFFNAMPDPDGAIRTIPLVVSFQNDLYAPLSLSILKRYLDNPLLQITLSDHGVLAIRMGQELIPVDDYGRFRINFRGPAKSFPYYSFADVVSGKVPLEKFRDKIVLVGASAVGIYDIRITPFSSIFPGVEVHANVMDNILRRDFLWAPTGLINPTVLVVIIMALAMGWLQPRIRAWIGLALLISLILLYGYVNYYLFSQHQIYLQMLYPLGCLVTVYMAVAFMRFIAEEKERMRIKAAFQNYVAPDVVNTMLQHPDRLQLGGEKREMTVLFSDIRGFTTLSEQMEPEVLVELLHSYLNPMTDTVFKHQGTMDKYIGDAIMAIYGAPLILPDHADRACETALEMMEKLRQLWEGWRAQGLPELRIGIGINSGAMTVGNMGSERLFDYTVIGDNVNLASRLEGLNKYYGTAILISEATQKLLQKKYILREVDRVRVKGKKAPASIFELRGIGQSLGKDEELLQTFQAGLEAFRRGEWAAAEKFFSQCLQLNPDDGPAKLLLGRTQGMAQQPIPPDWDGVTSLTEK